MGGHNLIKMAELKQMFQAIGFGQVQTYIQSGNVLFESDEAAEPLRRRIEQEIKAVFGLDVPVVLRTAAEMEQIVRKCPYRPEELPKEESLYVALLAEAPSAAGGARLATISCGSDEFCLAGTEVYLLYRQPAHKSKLSNNLLEQKLGVTATTRNWATINKLVAMGKVMMP